MLFSAGQVYEELRLNRGEEHLPESEGIATEPWAYRE